MKISTAVSEHYIAHKKVDAKIKDINVDCEGNVSVKLYDLGADNPALPIVSISRIEIEILYKLSNNALNKKLLVALEVKY